MSTSVVKFFYGNPTNLPVASMVGRDCGPNFPSHFFSITHKPKVGGIDIPA